MTIYIVVFISFSFLSFVELFCKTNKSFMRIVSFISIASLLILTSCRGNNGKADYSSYKLAFERMTDVTNLFAPNNFAYEPIWSLVKWIAKKICNNFQFHLFLIGTICILLEHKYARNFSLLESTSQNHSSKALTSDVYDRGNYYFTIFMILWGLYYANIFVIRSSVALMITFYSITYIENREWKKFVICVLIAVGFHYSALVFMPAYIIYHFHSSLMNKILIALLFLGVGAVGIDVIASIVGRIIGGTIEVKILGYLKFSGDFLYGTGIIQNQVFVIGKTLINIGVLIIVGLYLWKFNKTDSRFEGYFNLYLIGSVLYLSTMVVGRAFARMSIYYNIFQIPMIMYFFKMGYQKNRRLYWLGCTLYVLIRMLVNYDVPYIFFWENL